MKRLLLPVALAVAALLPSAAKAQVSGYSFVQSAGTYTPVTGGTVLASATAVSGAVPSLDSYVDSIATFPFQFNGTTYTKCYVSSNGFITFGTAAPSTTLYTPISTTAAVTQGVIAAWARDLNAAYITGTSPVAGDMRYEITGSAPNRKLVIQWTNFRPTYNSSTTSAYAFDFQIVLDETTNKIQIVYGGLLGYVVGSASYASTAQIGLRGATTADYNNRTNTSSVNFTASAAGSSNSATQNFSTSATPPGMPASGLTYTWTPATCFAPSAVTVTGITINGGMLNWTAPSSAPSAGYEYEIRTSGAPGSGTAGLAASGTTAAGITSEAVSSLASATTYSVYVRSNCGTTDGVSVWTAAYTFTTLCNTFSVPYVQNFDAVTVPALPNCSSKEDVNGDGTSWKTATSSPSSTPNVLAYTYNSTNPADDWWFTPYFNLTAGTSYQIKFKYRGSGTTFPEKLEIKAGNTATAAGMTSAVLWSNTNITNTAYETVTINYTPATTGVFTFGWHVFSDADMNYLYVDDLSISLSPTCIEPTAVAASAITSSGATLSWTAPLSAPSAGYQYEVRTSGAAGSGATGLAASGSTLAGVTNATVGSLSPATTYTVYIRSNCGTTDGFSIWTPAYTFTTLCVAYAAPFYEGFNSGALPNCWTNSNTISSSDANLLWKFSGAPGYGTTSNGRPNGTFAWVDASSPYNAVVNLTSPVIDLSALTTPYLKFDWFKNNEGLVSGYNNNNLMVEGYNGTAWVTLFNDSTNSNAWRTVGIALPSSFAGVANAQFRFSVDKQLSAYFYDDVLLDSMSVTEAPTCLTPGGVSASAITATGAGLSWTAPVIAPSAGYQYEVRTSGAAGSGATGLAASGSTLAGVTNATVGGLTATTTYTVFVRSNCGSNYSAWTSAYTFTTPCNTYAAPFYEGFNTGTLPACWSNSNTISSTSTYLLWKFTGAPGYGTTSNGRPNGTFAWVDASSPYNAVVNLTSPVIDLSALTTPYLKFDWFKNNEGLVSGYNNNNLMVEGYNGTAWVTLFNDSTNSNAWRTVGIALPSSFAGVANAQFRFSVDKQLSAYFYDDVLLDSMSVTEAPTCFAPTAVVATAVTSSGATLSWTAPATAPSAGYEYEVRTSGAAGSGATGLVTSGSTLVGVTTATVGSLTSATSYTVYVRGNCGTTDGYSEWTAAYTFMTPCVSAALPVAESFNSNTIPTCWSKMIVAVQSASKITFVSTGASPTTSPFEGSHMVMYNSYSSTGGGAGSEERLISLPVTSVGASVVTTSFYWRNEHNTTYTDTIESVQVQYSTDGITWMNAGNRIPRHDGSLAAGDAVWNLKTVTLPAGAAGQPLLYVGYLFHSEYDRNMFMDSVRIEACTNPVVDLGADVAACSGEVVTLDAGNPGLQYAWSTGATTQTIDVTTAGTYSVAVSNGGCMTMDTVTVTLSDPLSVTLGADTAICSGDSLMLDAGNPGATYVWSTGATTQDINVSTPGTYTVTVSNSACSATDTIVVDEVAAPVAGTIDVSGGSPAYDFASLGTTGALTYAWDFGDGNTATTETASHTYTANGVYTVALVVTNACGQTGSATTTVTVSGLGIGAAAGQAALVQVYPNPASGLTMVDGKGAIIRTLEAVDHLGRVVYRSQPNVEKATLDVKGMAQGVYTLRIQTSKGNSTVKLVVR